MIGALIDAFNSNSEDKIFISEILAYDDMINSNLGDWLL